MTKKEKAEAIAAYSAMKERGISADIIMKFAKPAEIHGYHKGMFVPGGYTANPYRLIDKIKLRIQKGTPMNKRTKPTARAVRRRIQPVIEQKAHMRPKQDARSIQLSFL